MIDPPRNILVSYAYYKTKNLDKLASCRIAGDSGAYTLKTLGKKIEQDELIAWIDKWQHRLAWCASVDISGDQKQTYKNWNYVVSRGFQAIPTLHLGDDPSEMDKYLRMGCDFMGLGGLAGSNHPAAIQFRWLISVFQYAAEHHPEARFHGWGITRKSWLRLPFFSVDSSGWGAGYRYGRLSLRDPRTGAEVSILLNGRGTYTPEIGALLRDCYGVNPSEVSTSGPANRLLMVRLSALSAAVQEDEFRKLHKRHPISAPKWGRLGGWALPAGPNTHLSFGGCGAAIREEKVFRDLHGVEPLDYETGTAGPHIHLVDGHPEHIEQVADLAAGGTIK